MKKDFVFLAVRTSQGLLYYNGRDFGGFGGALYMPLVLAEAVRRHWFADYDGALVLVD